MIIIPFIIVYVVLLDIVDYNKWNGEIQSWMISYLAWGIFTYLLMIGFVSKGFVDDELKHLKWYVRFVERMNDLMFYIIGINFEVTIDRETLLKHKDIMMIVTYFSVPALAALLPAVFVGFIANYAMEEKFQLKCNDEIKHDLCFDKSMHRCCKVISSYDVSNSYVFIGGLASNVLAIRAAIRFAGYLMMSVDPESGIYAKRKE